MEDEAEPVQLSLPAGKYRVVAIAGTSEDYEIPSEPNLEDEIKLLGEKGAETPLMLGKADVTVGADRESRLELSLSYSVASIDVALSQVPSEVESIQVTLSSFYSSMDMNGEYVDAGKQIVNVYSANEAERGNAQLLELTNRGEKRDRVSCKTADGLGDDHIHVAVSAFGKELLEAFTLVLGSGNGFIGIHACILPAVVLNVVAVIADLCR